MAGRSFTPHLAHIDLGRCTRTPGRLSFAGALARLRRGTGATWVNLGVVPERPGHGPSRAW